MCSLKTFIGRNKAALSVLVVFYLGLFYVLHFTLIQHSIHVVETVGNKIIVEIDKK